MPRLISLAAAGRFILDNQPASRIGRGGTLERAATLTGFSTSFLIQYLFEGGVSTYYKDEEGFNDIGHTLSPVFGGPPLSHASEDSVNYTNTESSYSQYDGVPAWPITLYACEYWFRQPDLEQEQCVLIGVTIDNDANLGRPNASWNYPTMQHDGQELFWESEIDVYGDNKPHCLVEAHEIGNRNNYVVYLDGMPVAEGSNGGHIVEVGNWWGPSFNGNGSEPNISRSGADWGSAHYFDNGQTLSMLDVRNLFETSALDGHDMLNIPRWFILDSLNTTIQADTGIKQANLGDVSQLTGIRGGSIPRIGKVYFEFKIINQGQHNTAVMPGISMLAEGNGVGANTAEGNEAYWIKAVVKDGKDVTVPNQTGNLGSSATNSIFQVAIDWDTGSFWFGSNGTSWCGIGGAGDPSNGLNPFTDFDTSYNWAPYVRNNGGYGLGKVMLITAAVDLNYEPPTGFVVWEDVIDYDSSFDLLYDSVVLLVRSKKATNGQITFKDESPIRMTLTRQGDVIYNNAQTKFGAEASMLFDGLGDDWISVPNTANLDFSNRTTEFCIEAWIYVQDLSTDQTIINGRGATSAEEWAFHITSSGDLVFDVYGAGFYRLNLIAPNVISINTWYHVAVTREEVAGNGLGKLYVGGLQVGSLTQTVNGTLNGGVYQIGHQASNNTRDFEGHMDSLRVTRGNIRYTGNFTPPTAPFPIQTLSI